MRICMIVKYPPRQGGVSAQAALLADELSRLGHKIYVVTMAVEEAIGARVWWPNPSPEDLVYLGASHGDVQVYRCPPSDTGTTTQLAGLAIDVIREFGCHLVYSNYLEPYGVAAHLAASHTSIPHVMQTAGSDRIRLMDLPGHATMYKEVLRHADVVMDGRASLLGLGIDPMRLVGKPRNNVCQRLFKAAGPQLDLERFNRQSREQFTVDFGPAHLPNDKVPIIGMYGKPTESKSLYDLIPVLAQLRESATFRVVLLTGGLQPRLREQLASYGIDDITWALPFIPYSRVPEYLRSCDLIVTLERGFDVKRHVPMRPREVSSVGTRLLVSRELFDKERPDSVVRRSNSVTTVSDPRDRSELLSALGPFFQGESPRPDPHRGPDETDDAAGTDDAAWVAAYASAFEQARASGQTDDAPTDHRPVGASRTGSAVDLVDVTRHVDAALELRDYGDSCDGSDLSSRTIRDVVRWCAIDSDYLQGRAYFATSATDVGTTGPPSDTYILRSRQCMVVDFTDRQSLGRAVRQLGPLGEQFNHQLEMAVEQSDADDADDPICLVVLRRRNLMSTMFLAGPTTSECLRRSDGRFTVAQLAKQLDVDVGRLSTLIDRLRSVGLVCALASPADTAGSKT